MKIYMPIVLILFLYNCSIENKSTIEIKVDLNKTIDHTSMPRIDIVNKILLQTEKYSVFNDIAQLETFRDAIYIHEVDPERRLFLFDKSGKFITSNKVGKGPGETIDVSAFYIEREDELVYIWDQTQRKLSKFDYKLNYISAKIIENKYTSTQIDQLDVIEGSHLLAFKNMAIEVGKTIFSYYVFDLNLEFIESFLPVSENISSYYTYDSFSREKNTKRLLTRAFDQTIYEMDGIHNIIPKYYIDFGKYNLLQEDLDLGIFHSVDLYRKGKCVLGFQNIIHTTNYICFNFGYNNDYENYLIYNKYNKKVMTSRELISFGLVPKGKMVDYEDNNFILAVQPDNYNDFLKSNSSIESDTVTLVSNPILLYLKVNF